MSIIDTFNPSLRKEHDGIILLFVGRIIIERNLKNFLDLPEDLGTKIVASYSNDPNADSLRSMYPHVKFIRFNEAREVAEIMANADVLVSPYSKEAVTEANLCGTPVATLPTVRTSQYITDFSNGCINDNLEMAVIDACTLNRSKVRTYAETYLLTE